VKIVIMNNGYLGMVRQWQEMFMTLFSEVDLSVAPDFVKLAEAYAHSVRAPRVPTSWPSAESGSVASGVAVIEVVVSREENVFPSFAGASARDMIFQSEGV